MPRNKSEKRSFGPGVITSMIAFANACREVGYKGSMTNGLFGMYTKLPQTARADFKAAGVAGGTYEDLSRYIFRTYGQGDAAQIEVRSSSPTRPLVITSMIAFANACREVGYKGSMTNGLFGMYTKLPQTARADFKAAGVAGGTYEDLSRYIFRTYGQGDAAQIEVRSSSPTRPNSGK